VKRYREDKRAADADTFATLQAIYQQMTGASVAAEVIHFRLQISDFRLICGVEI
jgi:hypothetical protein